MNVSRQRQKGFTSGSSLASFFLVCLLLLGACNSVASTHTAKPPVRLQKIVDAAMPGDTIVLTPGKYFGNVTLTKRVVIFGQSGTVIRGDGVGSVLMVLADSCVLAGLTIEHSGTMLVDEDAGLLVKSNANVIERNELRDVLFGVYILKAGYNIVRDNTLTGRKELEVGERGSGMHIWNSRHNVFIGNRITDVRDGFYIQNASHTWIEGNESYNVRYGLHYMYADSNTFLYNAFHDNVAGAAIMYSRGIVMRHNVFARNRGYASFGILFQDCHDLRADSNVIADNVVGMFFEASTDNLLKNNIVARNDIALQMFQNSENNVFSGNNFIDNLTPLVIVGKRTGSEWSLAGKGNYWSSYDGYDLDGDGIGDVEMKIQNVFQYLEGRNQNVRLYLYSPVSQALAVSSQAFPVLRINEEADRFPLMQAVTLGSIPAVQVIRSRELQEPQPARHAVVLPLTFLIAASVLSTRLLRGAI